MQFYGLNMCGICGKINFNQKPIEDSLLRRMTACLVHRGPDDEGIYIKENIGLGHKRLAIIDLSPKGHQPMSYANGRYWIVYNGEMYNFKEERELLEKKGYHFISRTDTEVVLALYQEYGAECLQRMRGMFAFAIWDKREKTLFLARDRIGEKPLFYYLDDSCLIFASEIKAILQDPTIERRPDMTAISHYLTYQDVPAPFSAFKGIKKLPPAHYIVCRNGKVDLKRYWKLSYLPKFSVETPSGEKELETEILDKLREAVKIRLVSDVPFGAFLSGGVDSSAVVALMSELMDEPVKTFSIGFKEAAYNEVNYARMIAERFNTDHTEFIVEPNALDILPELIWHYNEPFADSSAIPTYYVSKLAREHVTVVLNGDGGDENFAGYGRYAANEMALKLGKIFSPSLVKALLPLIMKFPHGSDPDNFFWRLKRFLQEFILSPELRNGHWLCHFTTEMKQEILTDDFKSSIEDIDSFGLLLEKFREAVAEDFLDKALYADVMMYLPDDLLVKVDIASMANSLEARSPFLDHRFMEFVAKIPSRLKLKGTIGKYILKKALTNILPDQILKREKMGFGVPIDHWFRNELKGMAYDTILSKKALDRGYFKKEALRKILDEHSSGKWNWHNHIWNLLMLELWHQMFIDSAPLPSKGSFAHGFR
ncbi:MAG: asparagine synthase (glutamine-hydrolyzing) [Proteobacteria bacterium]|nr:asparagine synthase (glutamine-hydrolyzing) [Desulfobacteraceae bacterium]MBU4013906.1 asparagine synthase (glutamine-hydrolyzing) [Pseudomonadota bacterium]MBU4127254.1 asparagine synthase (glutamine-hydrolyzing) [Pseudomonadota bacterium]